MNLSDEEWIRSYDDAWKHDADNCLHSTEIELVRDAIGQTGLLFSR